MSRIGKQPIKIPENVEIKISVNSILVKGPKGEISKNLHPNVIVEEKDGEILVKPKNDSKESRALWGTYRSLINNMVKGVKDGFEKVLIYEGIGFKSEVKSDSLIESGKILELNVGFTHSVKVPAPKSLLPKV